MTRKTPAPTRITHAIWAQLQTGLISAIHHDRASLRVEGKFFVMRGHTGAPHMLSIYETSADRLDAHWRMFAAKYPYPS